MPAPKLTPTEMAELAREREFWRDKVFQSRPAVEAIIGPDGWGGVLERALQPSALLDWLVSLAGVASLPAPRRRPSDSRERITPAATSALIGTVAAGVLDAGKPARWYSIEATLNNSGLSTRGRSIWRVSHAEPETSR